MDNLDESDHEGLFSSPSKKPATSRDLDKPKTPSGQNHRYDDSEGAREASLRRELDGVRNINELIEGVIGTLDRSKGNMQTVSSTVTTASTLLNTWTRILSQTEHNQRLILNPTWKGATQDLTDVENEAAEKQAAAERKLAEEERRKTNARLRMEEESRAREAAVNTRGNARSTRGLRGTTSTIRTRNVRGTTSSHASSTGYSGTRTSSGIGRGTGSVRGRSRASR